MEWPVADCLEIPPEENNNGIALFPNPAKDELNIVTPKYSGEAVVKISDAIGAVVYSAPVKNSTFKIQTSGFGKGIYFVQVISNDQRMITAKFVVM